MTESTRIGHSRELWTSEARRKLDDNRDTIIREHVEDGVPAKDLADRYGVNRQTLRAWMKDNDVAIRGAEAAANLRRLHRLESVKDLHAEIVRLRLEDGLKIREIVERLKLSTKIVTSALAEAGATKPHVPAPPKPAPPPRGTAKLDSLRAEVLAAVAEGLSGRQLAERFSVSQNSVLSWIKTNDVKLSPMTQLQKQIVALWQSSDLNLYGVAKRLDCGRTTVAQTLRKAGLIEHSTKLGRPTGSIKEKRSWIYYGKGEGATGD